MGDMQKISKFYVTFFHLLFSTNTMKVGRHYSGKNVTRILFSQQHNAQSQHMA